MSRARQINVEACAAPYLAVAVDPTTVLLDDAEDHGQPQACAPALALGREEGLEDARADFRRNPQAGVLHAQAHEWAGSRFQVQARVVLVQLDVFCLQEETAALGHGVAR